MARCETCGNDYDKSFDVIMMGETHTFDSFECAMHTFAPVCPHCGVRIAGHGVEQRRDLLLRPLCRARGASRLRDRV